ncbi:hypothetical protein AURANDRAFT_67362 [Aureococcus anophagefferens]|uniref:Uncharacterized protein n=1 Tax=Aureococcus anophagefferens TaxID=44056 RepID=F0YKW5_AURAN|nr:hypothetical protein AURANDRAFT_67362 [Aureococcus anophagefferens]EGB04197.1 hypothetical protein AURANDRAFT_67362 [Aureococcus anophagefferens]|eukprot:XP_009041050.1 hypothetical protein AURANDRAFT_67362 [Aureococcus anophagefferens]
MGRHSRGLSCLLLVGVGVECLDVPLEVVRGDDVLHGLGEHVRVVLWKSFFHELLDRSRGGEDVDNEFLEKVALASLRHQSLSDVVLCRFDQSSARLCVHLRFLHTFVVLRLPVALRPAAFWLFVFKARWAYPLALEEVLGRAPETDDDARDAVGHGSTFADNADEETLDVPRAFKGWERWRRHQDALDDQSSDSDDDDEFFVPAAGAAANGAAPSSSSSSSSDERDEDHQKEVKAAYNAAVQRHEQEQEEWRKQIGQFLLYHAEARDEQGSRSLTIQGCRPSEWECLKEECDQCSTFDRVDLDDPVVWNHIMEQYVEVQSSLLFHDDDEGPAETPMEGHRQRKNGSVRVFVSKSIDDSLEGTPRRASERDADQAHWSRTRPPRICGRATFAHDDQLREAIFRQNRDEETAGRAEHGPFLRASDSVRRREHSSAARRGAHLER